MLIPWAGVAQSLRGDHNDVTGECDIVNYAEVTIMHCTLSLPSYKYRVLLLDEGTVSSLVICRSRITTLKGSLALGPMFGQR